ncbi:MAG: competence protein ComEC [Gaiellaceae bacterium]|nr:competence protein ComEC [Gaiellaceae bacterium]
MRERLFELGGRPHLLALALCVGVAAANVARATTVLVPALACALVAVAGTLDGQRRLLALALGLGLAGWWWGAVRLEALDRSVLRAEVGRAETSLLVVTAPARRSMFDQRIPAQMLRFGRLGLREPVLLELPLGRSPPQGSRLEVLGEIRLPRGPSNGFDEHSWLKRRGIHVVLRGDRWRVVGRRGGVASVPDRLRERLAGSVAIGVHGERRGVLMGVVLGDDGGLSDELRQRFRASGLYHLLAVSGQNVALVAGAVLVLVWLAGLPRWVGHVGALAGMAGYVLAVGPQPSVLRAGVAGALGSLAWLAARQRDRWYFLLVGALVLEVWNPYVVLDAGFQLSFAAVLAIFTLVRPILHFLEGYPVPRRLAEVLAVSTACGTATAPVAWLQFHAIPLLTVPANAMAAPAVVPLLGLALAAVAVAPFSPGAASALDWLNGWCAAYLAWCARFVGGLPGAQIRSGWAAGALACGAVVAAAYAWRRWPRSSSPSI